MYELRPIINFDKPIEFPTCMYKQKNFHADEENGLSEKSNSSICPDGIGTFEQSIEGREMAELEKRQEKLLSQIEELKKIMNDIKSHLKPVNSTQKFTTETPRAKRETRTNVKSELKVVSNIPDLTISVNPNYPPYFLKFLQELWKNEVCLKVTFYMHSSVTNLPKRTELFVKKFEEKHQVNGAPSVHIRLIWKEIGPNAELFISHYPIIGEANVLRYFARVLNNSYATSSNSHKLDSLLDLSYKFSNTCSKTVRNNLLQTLNNFLGKNKWLGDQNNATIADVAVYDCLKKFANASEMSGNLSKWFSQCEQYVK